MITPGANDQMIPSNRMKCFACESSSNGDCQNEQTDTTLILPCRNFAKPEQCVIVGFTDGRGKNFT